MYGWLEYGRVEDGWATYTEAEVQIFSDPFFYSSSWNLSGCIISRTPTQILVVIPLPACRLDNARDHAFF